MYHEPGTTPDKAPDRIEIRPKGSIQRLTALKADILRLADESLGVAAIAPNGKPQSWLIDLRPLFMRIESLRAVADAFWRANGGRSDVQLAGMEVAAIPLLTGLLLAQPADVSVNGLIIRKERKTTGFARAIEGVIMDKPVILVDDIINSGDSAEKARIALADAGLSICEMFVVIDYRSKRGMEWRKKHAIKVRSLFTLDDFGLTLGSNKKQ